MSVLVNLNHKAVGVRGFCNSSFRGLKKNFFPDFLEVGNAGSMDFQFSFDMINDFGQNDILSAWPRRGIVAGERGKDNGNGGSGTWRKPKTR